MMINTNGRRYNDDDYKWKEIYNDDDDYKWDHTGISLSLAMYSGLSIHGVPIWLRFTAAVLHSSHTMFKVCHHPVSI